MADTVANIRRAVLEEAERRYEWMLSLLHTTEAERVVLAQKLDETRAMLAELTERVAWKWLPN